MRDTESDSHKLNIKYSAVLPNVEGCLCLLVGIFMDCQIYELTTHKYGVSV